MNSFVNVGLFCTMLIIKIPFIKPIKIGSIKDFGLILISNFFLLTLGMRLLVMGGVDLRIQQIMALAFFLVGVYCFNEIKPKKAIDRLIIIYLSYIVLNALLIDYPGHYSYLYKSLLAQFFPIFAYFMGRSKCVDLDEIFKRMKWPLLFAMICGLIFFFRPPSWYTVMKEQQIKEAASAAAISGVWRLSSFWGHPYVLGYSTLLYSLYLLNSLLTGIKEKRERYEEIGLLFVCIVVLLLAQLRITLFIFVLAYLYMLFLKSTNKMRFIKMLFYTIILLGLLVYIFSRFDSDVSDYIVSHILQLTEEDSLEGRFEHTGGGVVQYSVFGNGFGRYGFLAREYGKWALVDQEFQNHMAELGYVGVSLLLLIIFTTGLHCAFSRKKVLDTCVFGFFVLAMVGASVLSNHHQFNYIFWFAVGKLWTEYKPNRQDQINSLRERLLQRISTK